MMTRCLSCYRKEWRYALHLAPSDSGEKEATTFKQLGLVASSAAKADGTPRSNEDLRGAVGALPAEQRRLIEELFWGGTHRNRSGRRERYQSIHH